METQSARDAAPAIFAPGKMAAVAFISALLSMAGFAVLVSPATAKRYWRYARAWLHREVDKGNGPGA